MTTEFLVARRDIIASRLAAGHEVVATTLAHEFSVSEDAIRRDLRALAAEGRCRRVYGGALPPLPVSPASTPFIQRMGEDVNRKAALAQAAAALVQPAECIFLDNGSSNLAIVGLLPRDYELTVATNSVQIAAELLRRGDVQLIMLGGVVDNGTGGCTGAQAVEQVRLLNIDRCFLGACAVSAGIGIGAFDPADAVFKRVLLTASAQVAVLATTDKLETRAPYRVSTVADIDQLIVEHDAPPASVAALVRAGAVIVTAAPPA
ncbi:MAG: DeoR/GlpR family DNA-binding transcription regulator [Pseudomonadota bacterium]|nr:DeoR/GlpR family DNA-binding transcription regulator [Pseudomonadota bacterium]